MATGHRIIRPGMSAGKVGLSDTHGLRFQLTQGPVFPGGSDSKESACNAGDGGLDPCVGKTPLEKGMVAHSSILAWENLMDRGAWQATVRGVATVGHD